MIYLNGMATKITFDPKVAGNPDFLHVNRSKRAIEGKLNIWTVKDGEFMVSIIPTLNITGYGATKDEALGMLREALDDYFSSLVNSKQEVIDRDLSSHGWVQNKITKKNFDGPFINKKGVLQNFSLPETTEIEESVLTI